MHIRPATLADISSILRLERQCATAGHWTEEQYRQAFQPGGVKTLVLVMEASKPTATDSNPDRDVVGFLVARHLAPEWELENIVIDPAARRKGLGKLLLDALVAAARETHSDSVFLEVRESNTAARSLYEEAAFVQTGRRKSYYTNPAEDALQYRRTIG